MKIPFLRIRADTSVLWAFKLQPLYGFDYICLMISDVENLFMFHMTTSMSSLEKDLLKYSAHF